MTDGSPRYDAVVVGAGHNGLVAGAYLAKAGLRVLILERRDRVGGILTAGGPGIGAEAPAVKAIVFTPSRAFSKMAIVSGPMSRPTRPVFVNAIGIVLREFNGS